MRIIRTLLPNLIAGVLLLATQQVHAADAAPAATVTAANVTAAKVTAAADTAAAATAAGTWNLSVQAMGRTNTPTVVIAQTGAKLSGTYKGRAGQYPIVGEASGKAVKFDVAISMMGREMKLRYSGSVDGDRMQGSVSMGGEAAGTFTGTRGGQ